MRQRKYDKEYWAFTDASIAVLKRRYIRMFSRLKSLVNIDEMHLLNVVNETYTELDAMTRKHLLKIAQKAYDRARGPRRRRPDDWWLDWYLGLYDPVTKYQYDKEVERKVARCFEGLMASRNPQEKQGWAWEIKTALRYWTLQGTQYCDNVTKAATIKAFEERGVKRVRWVTAYDDRVCAECEALDGKVFDLSEVPPTPHYNCRCTLEEV